MTMKEVDERIVELENKLGLKHGEPIEFINNIKTNKAKEIENKVMGLEIYEAALKLGHWYRLTNQFLGMSFGEYIFERVGVHTVVLKTDAHNIVRSVKVI